MSTQELLPSQRICRACLTDQKEVPASVARYWQSINDLRQPCSSEPERVRIAALLRNCVPDLLVSEQDELPQLICPLCLAELENMHNFQQKCLSSEQKMHQRLEQETKQKVGSQAQQPRVRRTAVNQEETQDPLQDDPEPVEDIGTWLKFEPVSDDLEDNPELVFSGLEGPCNQRANTSKEKEGKRGTKRIPSNHLDPPTTSAKMKKIDNLVDRGNNIGGSSTEQAISLASVMLEMQRLKDTIQQQNETIMSVLARHTSMMEKLVGQDHVAKGITNIFPIKSVQEMENLEELLEDNHDHFPYGGMPTGLQVAVK